VTRQLIDYSDCTIAMRFFVNTHICYWLSQLVSPGYLERLGQDAIRLAGIGADFQSRITADLSQRWWTRLYSSGYWRLMPPSDFP